MNRLPSFFVSHGAPSFAIEPGLAGPRLTALGRELPKPRAVLIVSPHWMTPRPQVGMVERPGTIHDFGGFDPALYEIDYPVHGHPQLARRALERLQEAGWSPRPD
ncbi:MAG TPA: class III extradiol ring-cleavage dioxygenase, partial [Accumulibacter sp.]|nr:class III extradiol ring-cleavage dioxygenase [Accumulibacter sp.]